MARSEVPISFLQAFQVGACTVTELVEPSGCCIERRERPCSDYDGCACAGVNTPSVSLHARLNVFIAFLLIRIGCGDWVRVSPVGNGPAGPFVLGDRAAVHNAKESVTRYDVELPNPIRTGQNHSY